MVGEKFDKTMSMNNLYYRIWVDGILKIKENPLRKQDWKWMIQAYVGIAMALNFVLILFLINYLGFTDKMLILEFEILPFKNIADSYEIDEFFKEEFFQKKKVVYLPL